MWQRLFVLGLAVLLASSAFASNKGTLLVGESFEVSGQQLKAGEYQVRWDGTGSTVEVSFFKNNKEVAKTSAKLVTADKAYSSTPRYSTTATARRRFPSCALRARSLRWRLGLPRRRR